MILIAVPGSDFAGQEKDQHVPVIDHHSLGDGAAIIGTIWPTSHLPNTIGANKVGPIGHVQMIHAAIPDHGVGIAQHLRIGPQLQPIKNHGPAAVKIEDALGTMGTRPDDA